MPVSTVGNISSIAVEQLVGDILCVCSVLCTLCSPLVLQ
jgi:hypothetical protein